MKTKKEAPGCPQSYSEPNAKIMNYFNKRNHFKVRINGIYYNLGRVQFRVFYALQRGCFTAGQLCQRAKVTDPRGHISDLRKKGIPIRDIRVKSKYGTYCKRYYLEGEQL